MNFIILKTTKISQIYSRKKIPKFCHNVIRAYQQHVLHQDLTTEKLQGISLCFREASPEISRPILHVLEVLIFLFSQILKWLRPSVEGINIWNSVLPHPLHRLVIAFYQGPYPTLKNLVRFFLVYLDWILLQSLYIRVTGLDKNGKPASVCP